MKTILKYMPTFFPTMPIFMDFLQSLTLKGRMLTVIDGFHLLPGDELAGGRHRDSEHTHVCLTSQLKQMHGRCGKQTKHQPINQPTKKKKTQVPGSQQTVWFREQVWIWSW